MVHGAVSTARPARQPARRTDSDLLVNLLDAAAAADPERIAVIDGSVRTTYRELSERSAQLARSLIARGAAPETVVAIAIPRSLPEILAVWAVARTGAAFVLIDPGAPPARIRQLLAPARPLFGITGGAPSTLLGTGVSWVDLQDPTVAATVAAASGEPITDADRIGPLRRTHPAYLSFTGPVGTPRAAMLPHSGLVPLCTELRRRFDITGDSRTLAFARPGSDAAVLELLLAICGGATLVIAPKAVAGGITLTALLARTRVSHAYLSPAALATLYPADLPNLRILITDGEPPADDLVARLTTAGRHVHYRRGPVEYTIATGLSDPLRPGEPIPVGPTVSEVIPVILDDRLRPVGAGERGELYLAGPGLARGYRDRPGRTAGRFVAHPMGGPGTRLFRTGESARWADAGMTVLEYLTAGPTEVTEPDPVPASESPTAPIAVAHRAPEPAVEPAPMTAEQRRLWRLNRSDPGNPADNLPLNWRLTGNLDPAALWAALRDVVTRQEILRTVFPAGNDGPYQRVLPVDAVLGRPYIVPVTETDLPDVLDYLAAQACDLTERAPLRAQLLRLGDHELVLAVVLHRIIADDAAAEPFARDLAACYAARRAGRAPELPALPIRYADYARTRQHHDESPPTEPGQSDPRQPDPERAIPRLELPADRPRPAGSSGVGRCRTLQLSATTHADLRRLARTHNSTLPVMLRTVLAVLVARLSGAPEVLVTDSVTEPDAPTNALVGSFSGAVSHRYRVDPHESLTNLVERTCHVAPEPLGGAPAQIEFAVWHRTGRLELADGAATRIEPRTVRTRADLRLVLDGDRADARPGPLELRLEYSADLFDEPRIVGFAERYRQLATAAVGNLTTPIVDLDWLGPTEVARLNPGRNRRPPRTVAERFTDRPTRNRHVPALLGTDVQWSQPEVTSRVNRLARWLIGAGVGPERVVWLAMRPGPDLVIALLAVAVAGGAALPVDRTAPPRWIARLRAVTDPHLVLTSREDDFLDAIAVDTLDLDGLAADPVVEGERRTPLRPDHAAWLVARAGTDHRPIVTTHSHDSVIDQIDWLTDVVGLSARDSVVPTLPPTAPTAAWEYLAVTLVGGTIAVADPTSDGPERLLDRMTEQQITLLCTTPERLDALLATADVHRLPPSLRRVVLVGADPLPTAAITNLARHNPMLIVHSTPSDRGTRGRVLDDRLRLCPDGVPGELYLPEPVARGYPGRPGRTAGWFTADPYGSAGDRIHRTGVLAQRDADGGLQLLGPTRPDSETPDPPVTDRADRTADYAPPRTAREDLITGVFGEVLGIERVGLDDGFDDLGGDSQLLITLRARLAERAGVAVPMSMLALVDTPRGIAERFLPSPAEPSDPADDPRRADALLASTIDVTGCAPPRHGPPRSILLTGATGFLGTRLLRELLSHTAATVFCLIRADDEAAATRRLTTAMRRYRVAEGPLDDRVVPLPGDLAAPLFGVPAATFDQLADTIDVIFHAGAETDYLKSYRTLRAPNVAGTETVLRLASTRRIKPVHYVSTSGTAAGGSDGSVVLEQPHPVSGRLPSSGYLAGKWVGEQLVLAAAQRGVPVVVHRPSHLVGDVAAAANNPRDPLWQLLRAIVIVGAAPRRADFSVDLMPVTFVSGAIVAIATRGPRQRIYHLTGGTRVGMVELVAALQRRGHRIEVIAPHEFAARVATEADRRYADGDESLTEASLMAVALGTTSAHPEPIFDNQSAKAALSEVAIGCPAIDPIALDGYLGYLTEIGFLPGPR